MSRALKHGLAGLGLLLAASGPSLAADGHDMLFGSLLVDQLEHGWRDGQDTVAWKAQGWIGGDVQKLYLKTEGEYVRDDTVEKAEVQLLYSRMIADFWDVQAGIRHDFRPDDPSRTYGVFGFQGLAPYVIEMDASLFVSEKGDISARFEAEHDILITQRLIAQPKLEVSAALQEVEELGIGSGLNDIELGFRVRYEITRKFAPYVGISWSRSLGNTADFARAEGEDVDNLAFLTGIRFAF